MASLEEWLIVFIGVFRFGFAGVLWFGFFRVLRRIYGDFSSIHLNFCFNVLNLVKEKENEAISSDFPSSL